MRRGTIKLSWAKRSAGQTPWGHPEPDYYVSGDGSILRQHAEWLSAANVDFALVDWSNDLGTDTRDPRGSPDQLAIENTTPRLFDTWPSVPRHPKIAFLIGVPGPILRAGVKGQNEDINTLIHGDLHRKADQIYQHTRFAPMLETYLGKPLLVVMIGVPKPDRDRAPNWSDPRFTVRSRSAYLSEFPGLTGPDNIITRGYWLWEDRVSALYTVHDGHPKAMMIVAAWRPVQPGVGRHRPPGRQDVSGRMGKGAKGRTTLRHRRHME